MEMMDHAINAIKQHMQSTIFIYQGQLTKEEIEPEITAYVKAINELEKYYHGETKTTVESVLAHYA